MRNKKGMTLVELIIVMAIMTIVSGAIFSYFMYENRVYKKTSDLFDIQSEARTTAFVISEKLRNAETLSLTNSPTGNNYIKIDSANKKIDVRENAVTSETCKSLIVTNSYFTFNTANPDMLILHLEVSLNSESYMIDTEILLSNLALRPLNNINGTSGTHYSGIVFTK